MTQSDSKIRERQAEARQAVITDVAAHEAGHAVAYWCYGEIVLTLNVSSDDGGFCQPRFPSGQTTVESVRQSMVMTAAGPAAAALLCGTPAEPSGKDADDLQRMARTLHGMLADEATIKAEIDEALQRAQALVQRHAKAIHRVAVRIVETTNEIATTRTTLWEKEIDLEDEIKTS